MGKLVITKEELKALEDSIVIWNKKKQILLDNFGKKFNLGMFSNVNICPLCDLNTRFDRERGCSCCIITKYTNDGHCYNTPYYKFTDDLNEGEKITGEKIDLAQDMINLLEEIKNNVTEKEKTYHVGQTFIYNNYGHFCDNIYLLSALHSNIFLVNITKNSKNAGGVWCSTLLEVDDISNITEHEFKKYCDCKITNFSLIVD